MVRNDQVPLKVLHVLGRMEPGGAEIRLLELIDRLSAREFRVDVCALSGLEGSLDDRVRASGGDVIPLKLDASFPGRFIRLLKQQRYDVVHSNVLLTSGFILALAAAAGVPIRIAHLHSTEDGRPATIRRLIQRRVLRWLIDRFATNVVACGEGTMQAVWGVGWGRDSRCRIIYCGLDPDKFDRVVDRTGARAQLGIPADVPVFLHIGRESPEKNHGRLVRVFAQIREIAPDAWLVLVGAGTDQADGVTARTARECGLRDQILGLGVRHDVPELLKVADVLLLPSLFEGLPTVVLEACAAGVPVLASDLPGVREIAARFPMVRYRPLSTSDREWAMAALALPGDAEMLRLRRTAGESFRQSAFHVDHTAAAYRDVWSRRKQNLPTVKIACF
jgi:glycosyltransferase involved in cell wall biosynthesis